ncbi:hypothetical protein [Flavisolibacter ginsengisoli]|jgi:hypothetical protein|nr:hypothetical protein [Flavisolibacter ginsengisoli]
MKEYQINTVKDIKAFFQSLYDDYDLAFMPDDDFTDYTTGDNQPTFNKEEADYLNDVMTRCFDVADRNDADIYEVASEVQVAEYKKRGIFPEDFGANNG